MKHKLLLVPKLGREVNVIIVWVFKSLNLVPLHFKLLFAMRSDLIGGRTIIHALAVYKDRLLKLDCIEISKGFAFPSMNWIEYG